MPIVRLGESSIDLDTGVVLGGPRPLTLSDRERAILSALLDAGGGLVTREALGGGAASRAADMAVSRLRKRLGPAGEAILTVRGRGYRLDQTPPDAGLDLGWGRLELPSLRVRLPDRSVALTVQQSALLELLAAAPGRPVARIELVRGVWGREGTGDKLDLLVHRLRQRLEAEPSRPRFVVTVRGRGLALLDARSAEADVEGVRRTVDLVGRTDALARALGLLDSPARRALIHGPPGVGKSALAEAIAAHWAGAGEDRAARGVDLHGVSGPDEAEVRFAAALRMESARVDDRVARSLASHGPLVVLLDGALPAGWAERIEGWMGRAPQLRILVAAREAPRDWPTLELGGLEGAAARELLERAAGRRLGEEVDRLVQRLEGNPLALELVGRALARSDADAIDRRLALPLTPLRHAWQAAIEDLPPAAHDAALALSLFRRPFDLDDAAQVADLPDAIGPVLDDLLSRSVLQPRSRGRLALPHAARELLAGELRKAGGLRSARARFRARGRNVLDRIAADIPRLGGPALDELELRWVDLDPALPPGENLDSDQARLLARLAREAAERVPRERREAWADDLTAAADRDEVAPAARAACLRSVHSLRWGQMAKTERRDLLERALELAAGDGAPVLAAALSAEHASVLAFSFGSTDARRALGDHPLPEDAPDDERVRYLRHVGRLGVHSDRPGEGIPELAEAVRVAESQGLPLLEARCRIALGQALTRSTHEQEAEHHLRLAIALSAQHGLPEQQVRASIGLSQHLLVLGLREEAATLLRDALRAAVRAGLVRLEEQCVATLGFVLTGQGRYAEAVEALDRALELAEEHGAVRALFLALVNRGLARAFGGDPGGGRADLERGLALSRRAGWFRGVGLAYRAVAELLDGAQSQAAETAAEANAVLETLSIADAPHMIEALGRLAAHARGEDPAHTRAWLDGWTGGSEVEAVVEALRVSLAR